MISVLYRLMVRLATWGGSWFFSLFSRLVAAGFFIFMPGRLQESIRFYRALFPKKGRLSATISAWLQYQRFTRIHVDRMQLSDPDRIEVTTEGWEALEQVLDRNEGAILLQSHLGNWEAAAHLLKRRRADVRLLLYMGIRNGEQLEKLQKQGLADEGIKIVAVDQNNASPFQLIEANTFLNNGGLVSLTGDRIWHESQRSIKVEFLGHEIELPESPHLLALISEKPLFVLFPVRTGNRQFHVHICPPITVKAGSRAERKKAVSQSAQAYADLLADAARQYPLEWFHFEPFLGKRLD